MKVSLLARANGVAADHTSATQERKGATRERNRTTPAHDGLSRGRPSVLFICHNHPSVRPGGAEAYALELHRHLRDSQEMESVFLAKGGAPLSSTGRTHLGTYIAPVNGAQDEYFCFTEDWNYDWTMGTIREDKRLYTKHLRAFLRAIKPDVVHLHHTMFFGYDLLREIKNSLPQAPIVYTLHEFMPICHRQGQMLRTADDAPCMEESPRRCHECFPDISPQTFFLRKRFIQSHFSLVDRFIAPSAFLGERYIDWGIPREKVQVEEYGRTPPPGRAAAGERAHRDRFGFFGQMTPYKGLQILLAATALMQDDAREGSVDPLLAALERAAGQAPAPAQEASGPDPQVRVHGANLDLQPGQFQNQIKDLLARTERNVTFVGRYDHDDLASYMSEIDWVIVPSIWWENSPLVIQEAFHFERPIICSDIGGMAEKVEHGVNGLHFRAGDPSSLAAAMREAAGTPGLWERLRAGIRPVYRMEDHARRLAATYSELQRSEVSTHVG
jgi:glycosyltransferase involved in cell wall biosynthesis